MIQDVVTRTASASDWPSTRKAIHARILSSMGEFPRALSTGPWQTVRKYQAHGLEHEDGTFDILAGWRCAGTIVYGRVPRDRERRRADQALH